MYNVIFTDLHVGEEDGDENGLGYQHLSEQEEEHEHQEPLRELENTLF